MSRSWSRSNSEPAGLQVSHDRHPGSLALRSMTALLNAIYIATSPKCGRRLGEVPAAEAGQRIMINVRPNRVAAFDTASRY